MRVGICCEVAATQKKVLVLGARERQKAYKKEDLRIDLRNWTTASGGALDLKAGELTLATGTIDV